MDIKMAILNIALNTSEKSQYMQMGMHGLCRLLQHYTHLNICEFPTIRHSVNREYLYCEFIPQRIILAVLLII